MPSIKTISAGGQISLGKKYAGRTVIIESPEEGVWVVKAATVIPDNERRRNRKGNPYWQSFTSGKHGEAGKKILARLKFNLT